MGRFIRVSLLVACLSVGVVHGQGLPRHSIGFGIDGAYQASKDDLVAPFTFDGGRIRYALDYHLRGQKSRHTIAAVFGKAHLGSSVGVSMDETVGTLRYGYDRTFARVLDDRVSLFWGLAWKSEVDFRDYAFPIEIWGATSSEQSGDLVSALRISLMVERRAGSDAILGGRLEVPVFAYVLRPNYVLGPPEGIDDLQASDGRYLASGSLRTMDAYQAVQPSVYYERRLSRRVGLLLSYTFWYARIDDPRPSRAFANSLGLQFLIYP